MIETLTKVTPSSDRLLDVIRFQTEVVQLGIDLGAVMALVAERSQAITGAHGAVVELAEGEDMVYRAAAGIAEPQLGLRLKCSSSLSGYCLGVGEPVFCEDSETDPRVDRDACRRVGLRSMIVVPLKHHDEIVGVLKVMSNDRDKFNQEDVRILELMSGLIAASMANASKFETQELFYRATHDPLTDLSNRALFFDHLRQRLAQSHRSAEQFGILILDMDGLKSINDQYGHRAGDAAIKEFATRIRSVARESDTVARIGGDEFGILLYRLNSPEEASAVIPRLIQRVRAPFEFETSSLPLSASIGAAVFPDDGSEINVLVEKADQFMYEMKRSRKGTRCS